MLTDLHRFGFALRRFNICCSFLLLFLLWRIIRFVSRRSGWAFGDRFRRFCFRLQLELINLYLSKDHHICFLIIVRTFGHGRRKTKKKKKKQQKNFTAVTCEASKDQMSLLYQETALTS